MTTYLYVQFLGLTSVRK